MNGYKFSVSSFTPAMREAGFTEIDSYRTLDGWVSVVTPPAGTRQMEVTRRGNSELRFSFTGSCRYVTPAGVEFVAGGGGPVDLDRVHFL